MNSIGLTLHLLSPRRSRVDPFAGRGSVKASEFSGATLTDCTASLILGPPHSYPNQALVGAGVSGSQDVRRLLGRQRRTSFPFEHVDRLLNSPHLIPEQLTPKSSSVDSQINRANSTVLIGLWQHPLSSSIRFPTSPIGHCPFSLKERNSPARSVLAEAGSSPVLYLLPLAAWPRSGGPVPERRTGPTRPDPVGQWTMVG